jgi:hypothetical protein
MIALCCQVESWDGYIGQIQAERCSDVPEPARCNAQLVEAGFLMEAVGGGYVVLDFEDNHAAPLWVRNKTVHNKLNKRRKTAHLHDDHQHCEPSNCEVLKAGASGSASQSGESSAERQDKPNLANTGKALSDPEKTNEGAEQWN